MLERILARMGAEPVARSSNRNVSVETHRHPDGRSTVFVSNLHASPQTTHLTLYRGGRPAAERDLSLAAMQVSVADFARLGSLPRGGTSSARISDSSRAPA
jgi:hypothetical protein